MAALELWDWRNKHVAFWAVSRSRIFTRTQSSWININNLPSWACRINYWSAYDYLHSTSNWLVSSGCLTFFPPDINRMTYDGFGFWPTVDTKTLTFKKSRSVKCNPAHPPSIQVLWKWQTGAIKTMSFYAKSSAGCRASDIIQIAGSSSG